MKFLQSLMAARIMLAPPCGPLPLRAIRRALLLLLVAILSSANAASADDDLVESYPLVHFLSGIAEQQWEERAVRMDAIDTADEVWARGKFVRAEFLKAIGGLPERRGPLNARITGSIERPGYRVENLIYESLPGCHVTANLYVPTTGRGPFPAVIGASGHVFGEGKAANGYQLGWIALVLHGYVVLAYDPPAQGERFELLDPLTGVVTSGQHISHGLQCLLTGGTSARYFLWDGIRGLDYLLTRAEVDSKRIAAAGNSGGGNVSAFLAVVEPRLSAAAPSCYWTSWPKLWYTMGPQDAEQVLPGSIKAGLDFSDFAIAFAPKPITMLTATHDVFPVHGARIMYAEAKRLYSLIGAGPKMGYFEYGDKHGWSQPRREATVAWFNQWFYNRNEPVKEPKISPEKLEALRCTDTGHVLTSLRSKTVQMLNLEVAEALYPQRTFRTIPGAAKIRATVASRLAMPATRKGAPVKTRARTEHKDFTVEAIRIVPEPGMELRADVIIPHGSGAVSPAVIVLREHLSPVDPATDAEVVAWRNAGHVVIVAQLRGLLKAPENRSYYTSYYKTSMRALLVGRTMAGMRVQDLLAVFDYVAARPGIAPERITVLGRGNMGVVAQYAAALEPKINRVVADGSLLSYMDIVRVPSCPEPFADIIVPGALLDYDLPDLAAAAKGRIILVNPVSGGGQRVSESTAASAYGTNARILVTAATLTPDLFERP